jgi:hypothetical protein
MQNWNLEIQRELAANLTMEVRYVGSKGTKLWGRIPLNTVNIFENGILDAFVTTREGGDAELFDRMLDGINLGPGTCGVVDGASCTGSAALRASTTFRSLIANGDVGQFADTVNGTAVATGVPGGLLLTNGFTPNFIKVNPQFANVTLDGNTGNSTYHSLQLQLTKRLSQGFTNQTSYTWSRALGDNSSDGGFAAFSTSNHWFDPRNRSLNKTLLSFHRTHSIQSNGTFELPFGPNRALLGGATGVLARLVEQWQLGAIFSWTSGAPLTISASTSTITQANINTPVILGDFPKSSGEVTPDSAGGTYFPGLQQVVDPGARNVTADEGLRGQVSNLAVADAQGNPILANPLPGNLGTLGQRWIEGPGHIGLDVNLKKTVQVDENVTFELRVDVANILNTPWWTDPTTDINSVNFGRITGSGVSGASDADIRNGTRAFTLNARLSF